MITQTNIASKPEDVWSGLRSGLEQISLQIFTSFSKFSSCLYDFRSPALILDTEGDVSLAPGVQKVISSFQDLLHQTTNLMADLAQRSTAPLSRGAMCLNSEASGVRKKAKLSENQEIQSRCEQNSKLKVLTDNMEPSVSSAMRTEEGTRNYSDFEGIMWGDNFTDYQE